MLDDGTSATLWYMKHWTPLEYAASVVILAVVVAIAATLTWSKAAKDALSPLMYRVGGYLAHGGMLALGYILRPFIYLAHGLSCITWSLGDLWYEPLATFAEDKMVEPLRLHIKALHHRPEHAR